MAIDPDTIIETQVTEDGVLSICLGNAVSARMRRITVECLEHFLPSAHARYVQIKRPSGPKSATPETRRLAYAYALQAFTNFVLKYYLRIEE